MDISKQLHAYEVEYHVLQDEMLDPGAVVDETDRLDKLEKTNMQLKKQNIDLLEKLQVRGKTILAHSECNCRPFHSHFIAYYCEWTNVCFQV